MPRSYRYLVHSDSRALWPEHKPLQEVLELEASTPPSIFSATYQGLPIPPGGVVYLASWWQNQNRYDVADPWIQNRVIGRWLSYDTAMKENERNDYTASIVAELWPDYRLSLRHAWLERKAFPDLQAAIEDDCTAWNRDGKLRGVLIEDKGSGTSVIQTLRESSEAWIAPLLIPVSPGSRDKRARAEQTSIWCKNGCVLLPWPDEMARWLLDFEDQIFMFPGAPHDDYVDSFSQLLLFLEHLLSAGFHKRMAQGLVKGVPATQQRGALPKPPPSRIDRALADHQKRLHRPGRR